MGYAFNSKKCVIFLISFDIKAVTSSFGKKQTNLISSIVFFTKNISIE